MKLPKSTNNEQYPLIYADLTYLVRKAIFAVYNALGFGHKENVYQKALEKEFVELKSLSFLPEQLDAQVLQYSKITGFKLGLLVNFGSSKLFIKRLIWTSRQGSRSVSAENNPRKSIQRRSV